MLELWLLGGDTAAHQVSSDSLSYQLPNRRIEEVTPGEEAEREVLRRMMSPRCELGKGERPIIPAGKRGDRDAQRLGGR